MNPPYATFTFGAPSAGMNVRTKLTDLEDENRRLLLAKSELEQKLDLSWNQISEFHAMAQRLTAEKNMYVHDNTELRASKRRLEDELRGALSENSRLQMLAQSADAKRAKAEADVLHAGAECRRQANVIRQMETETSEIRTAAESLKLRKQHLASSLQNANVKVTGLMAEVLELKAKQTQASKAEKEDSDLRAKVTHLQRKVDELTAKNEGVGDLKARYEALVEENKKLKTRATRLDELNKEKASRLAQIAALAQGGAEAPKKK